MFQSGPPRRLRWRVQERCRQRSLCCWPTNSCIRRKSGFRNDSREPATSGEPSADSGRSARCAASKRILLNWVSNSRCVCKGERDGVDGRGSRRSLAGGCTFVGGLGRKGVCRAGRPSDDGAGVGRQRKGGDVESAGSAGPSLVAGSAGVVGRRWSDSGGDSEGVWRRGSGRGGDGSSRAAAGSRARSGSGVALGCGIGSSSGRSLGRGPGAASLFCGDCC